jgi:hypothetical protein
MSPDLPQPPAQQRQQSNVFTVLGVIIAGSLVFWPLLTSIASIAMFAYWLTAATKTFSLDRRRLTFLIVFMSLYALAIIGTFYSANKEEALFKLQQQSAIGMFPLVLATAVAVNASVCHRIFLGFAWLTLAGCVVCLGNGLIHLLQTGSAEMMHGYRMVILKDMSPFMLGLYCLLSVLYLLGAVYHGVFKQGREHTLYVTLLLLLSAFLFLLGNRNVLFSWILVAIFYLLMIGASRTIFIFCIAGGFTHRCCAGKPIFPKTNKGPHGLFQYQYHPVGC